MKFALVFPGQGAQKVGMGKDLFDGSAAARAAFEEADDALGFSLSDVIFQGPDEKLALTAYTQPAILTTCIALCRALQERGIDLAPAFVAGHSLGEYTALVASGCLSLADGVRLVHQRGSFMQEAVPAGEGSMAALLGLEDSVVEELCAEAAQGQVCEPANYNSPGQLVISGHREAVDRAVALAQGRGAKKAMMLNVSAPFHCSLMRPVADRLAAEMDRCAWGSCCCPLVANVSAQSVSSVDEIRQGLYRQTYSSVQWTQSVQFMVAQGVEAFIEIGPGKVLTAMIKRIHKGLQLLNLEALEDLDKAGAFLKGGQS